MFPTDRLLFMYLQDSTKYLLAVCCTMLRVPMLDEDKAPYVTEQYGGQML